MRSTTDLERIGGAALPSGVVLLDWGGEGDLSGGGCRGGC